MSILELRRQATQATLNAFEGKPFVWGTCDCTRLVDFQLKGLGVETPIGKFGSWANERGALRALKRNGFATLEGVLSSFRLPIVPAHALMGDIIGLQSSETDWVALTVSLGNGRVLGFLPRTDGPPIATALAVKWHKASEAGPVLAWRSC